MAWFVGIRQSGSWDFLILCPVMPNDPSVLNDAATAVEHPPKRRKSGCMLGRPDTKFSGRIVRLADSFISNIAFSTLARMLPDNGGHDDIFARE